MVYSHILAASAEYAALFAVTLPLPGHLAPHGPYNAVTLASMLFPIFHLSIPHSRSSLEVTKNYLIGQPPWVSIASSTIFFIFTIGFKRLFGKFNLG